MERPGGSRWLAEGTTRGPAYDQHWVELAAKGAEIHGEADFVDSLSPRSVLDAGCGTGRVAIELARRRIDVAGVDLDPAMLEAARTKAPELTWLLADLVNVDVGRSFDVVVLAGNVMIFLAPGSEERVVANLARHVCRGGALVAGFQLQEGRLSLDDYDAMAAGAGLVLSERWSTWDRVPFSGGDYAVSVHRRQIDASS